MLPVQASACLDCYLVVIYHFHQARYFGLATGRSGCRWASLPAGQLRQGLWRWGAGDCVLKFLPLVPLWCNKHEQPCPPAKLKCFKKSEGRGGQISGVSGEGPVPPLREGRPQFPYWPLCSGVGLTWVVDLQFRPREQISSQFPGLLVCWISLSAEDGLPSALTQLLPYNLTPVRGAQAKPSHHLYQQYQFHSYLGQPI